MKVGRREGRRESKVEEEGRWRKREGKVEKEGGHSSLSQQEFY